VRAAVEAGCAVDAIEIDPALCAKYGWRQADFLEGVVPKEGSKKYCAVICNPPFTKSHYHHCNTITDGGRQDYGLKFLVHASRFARTLGFLFSVYKGSAKFRNTVKKLIPETHRLAARIPVLEKEMCVFKYGEGTKRVPVDIHVYVPGPPSPILAPKESATDDFEIVKLDNPGANLLVKRWGSSKRIGRIVESEKDRVRAHVDKRRNQYGRLQGPNFHLKCKDPARVTETLKAAETMFDEHFSWSLGRTSGLCITPENFINIYCKAKCLQRSSSQS
jgi:hypothetical protein